MGSRETESYLDENVLGLLNFFFETIELKNSCLYQYLTSYLTEIEVTDPYLSKNPLFTSFLCLAELFYGSTLCTSIAWFPCPPPLPPITSILCLEAPFTSTTSQVTLSMLQLGKLLAMS